MPWTPALTVTSRRIIRDNIRGYVMAKQVEALAWVQSSPVLTPFTAFYKSSIGRALTNFPHLMIVSSRSVEIEVVGDDSGVKVRHIFLIEGEIAGSDAEDLTDEVEKRWVALDSIIRNIPMPTLMLNVGSVQHATLEITDHDPDVLRGQADPKKGPTKGQWLKVPQMIVTVELTENTNA